MSSNEKVCNALGERKEAMGTMLLAENKSLTKDSEKGTDELVDNQLSEKKSSANDVENGTDQLVDKLLSEKKPVRDKYEKGTDELADTLLSEKKNYKKKVEKGTYEKADTLLSKKKPLKKDVKKVTYELAFKKQKLHTILRKGLNQFEGQPTVTQGWFKLDIEFIKTTYSKSHSEFYKELFKNNIEYQDKDMYEKLVVPFVRELINRQYEKPKPHMISQSDAPAPEEVVVLQKQI